MNLLDITMLSLPTLFATAATVANVRLTRAAHSQGQDKEEKENLLRLLQRGTTASNRSATFGAASRSVLDDVCALTGWPVAHAYVVDGDTNEAVSAGVWRLPSRAFKSLVAVTEGGPLDARDCAVASAITSRQPARTVDLSANAYVPRYRAAGAAGLKSAFAFPVLVGYDVAGVIEFFSDRMGDPDAALLEVVADVVAQLGRALERDWADADLDERDEELVELRGGLEDATRSLETAEEQLRASEKQRRQTEKQLRESQEQVRASEVELTAVRSALTEVTQSVSTFEEKLRHIEEQLRESQDQRRESEAQRRESEDQLRKAEEQLRQPEEQVRQQRVADLGLLVPMAVTSEASGSPWCAEESRDEGLFRAAG